VQPVLVGLQLALTELWRSYGVHPDAVIGHSMGGLHSWCLAAVRPDLVSGIVVEDKLTLQTDPVQWVNQDSQTIKDIHEVEKLAGGSSELGVYATAADVFSDKFATFAHDLTRKTLEDHPKKLLTGSSIETAIGDIVNDVPGGSDIAPRGEDVKNAYDVAPSVRAKSSAMTNRQPSSKKLPPARNPAPRAVSRMLRSAVRPGVGRA